MDWFSTPRSSLYTNQLVNMSIDREREKAFALLWYTSKDSTEKNPQTCKA